MSKNEKEEVFHKSSINWFPGHMAKAKRELQCCLKFVDIVIEIVDARVPISSKNPDLESLIFNKPRLLVLNKSDMADKEETDKWLKHFKNQGINSVSFSVLEDKYVKILLNSIKNILKYKIFNWSKKGIKHKRIRAMVVGIPNVGKSSFINKLAKNSNAIVQNKPGVTRSNSWFLVKNEIEILDTPGILPPKIKNEVIAKNLAFTGAIKDEILDLENLAIEFLEKICKDYLENLIEKYKLEKESFLEFKNLKKLEFIGKKKGFLMAGGKVNLEQTAKSILTDFRNLKLGNITLEKTDICNYTNLVV